jgi:hypothetical protein
MAKRVTYKPDFKGVGQLLRSSDVQHVCVAAAERGKTYAESISPVRTGEYRRSFLVVPVMAKDRSGAKLINTSGHATAVEWILGFRVLGRTVDYIEKNGP